MHILDEAAELPSKRLIGGDPPMAACRSSASISTIATAPLGSLLVPYRLTRHARLGGRRRRPCRYRPRLELLEHRLVGRSLPRRMGITKLRSPSNSPSVIFLKSRRRGGRSTALAEYGWHKLPVVLLRRMDGMRLPHPRRPALHPCPRKLRRPVHRHPSRRARHRRADDARLSVDAAGRRGQPRRGRAARRPGAASAACRSARSIFDFVFATFNFLRSGTTGLVAQAFGAGDQREVAATLSRALAAACSSASPSLVLSGPILALALQLDRRQRRGPGGDPRLLAASACSATPFALANYVILGWLIGLGRAGYGLMLQTLLNGINIVLSASVRARPRLRGRRRRLGELRRRGDDGRRRRRWSSSGSPSAATWLELRAASSIGLAFLRMIAVNRDIMIRSFALLFAFAFFTAQERAPAATWSSPPTRSSSTSPWSPPIFLDGLAAAAEQFAGRAIGARYRPAFERSLRADRRSGASPSRRRSSAGSLVRRPADHRPR